MLVVSWKKVNEMIVGVLLLLYNRLENDSVERDFVALHIG